MSSGNKRGYLQKKWLKGARVFHESKLHHYGCAELEVLKDAMLFTPAYNTMVHDSDKARIGDVAFVYSIGRYSPVDGGAPLMDAGLNKENAVILKSNPLSFSYDESLHGIVEEICTDDINESHTICYGPRLVHGMEDMVVDKMYEMCRLYEQDCMVHMMNNKFQLVSSILAPLKNGKTNLILTLYFPGGKGKVQHRLLFSLHTEEGAVSCHVVTNPLFYPRECVIKNIEVKVRSKDDQHRKLLLKVVEALEDDAILCGYRVAARGNLLILMIKKVYRSGEVDTTFKDRCERCVNDIFKKS